MYINELLDAYKKAQNYVQDKQIAHDMNIEPNKVSKMRKGIRYVSDSEAVFLAEGAGIDAEVALLGCHADRNDNPQVKALWENIAKKFNGVGLSSVSTACAGLALALMAVREPASHYALCILC
ncbi:DUF3693 domain-containing protein [Vibrio sp. ZSDZ65]|uniref:DUF3693 domain-containing protein n=1 Tax=Vibrio qingdaonensis TaxID=2829491 RepID=A0A9X3CM86_9VIBR|nr:DUF3693 domain-containing protein [Vibrio qingdaonensis]MCW8345971.1 DUF3693 domain-containing protein [Vibrio qingdaonensis]